MARLDVIHGRQVTSCRPASAASGPRLGAKGAQAYPYLESIWIQALQHRQEQVFPMDPRSQASCVDREKFTISLAYAKLSKPLVLLFPVRSLRYLLCGYFLLYDTVPIPHKIQTLVCVFVLLGRQGERGERVISSWLKNIKY